MAAKVANETVPSLFAGALKVLPKLKSPSPSSQGQEVLCAAPFLSACREVLPVIDVFGSALSFVKSDIGGNIERLESTRAKDPAKFNDLYEIVRAEIAAGTAGGTYSNTNALLWLTRAMEFLLGLLKNLEESKEGTVQEAAQKAYDLYLSPYHGWLARNAFAVAMYCCPSRKYFFEKLGPGYVPEDLMLVLSKVQPVLKENHQFLESVGFDNLTAA